MTLTTLHLSNPSRSVGLRRSGVGEPMVLLHGVGLQSAAWAPQIEALDTQSEVIALDLPGHGDSDPLPEGSALPQFVDWLFEVVHSLNVGPINLVGHSMGALIASGFAITHPEAAYRVALLNGVHRRDEQASKAVMARATQFAEGNGEIDVETPLARWFGDNDKCDDLKKSIAQWLKQNNPNSYATAYSAFAMGDAVYADRFSTIECPFLALTGSDDPNSTPLMSMAMADEVQNGRAIILEGQRHIPNLTDAAAVNLHLRHWLSLPTKYSEAISSTGPS